MKTIVVFCAALAAMPAAGQTAYKCPSQTPSAPPVIQQMPCTPAGGGETIPVKPIKSTGSTLEINEQGREFMQSNKDRWAAQAAAEEKERKRQEDLNVERAKVKAAEEQAAAQRATARAIWATGRR